MLALNTHTGGAARRNDGTGSRSTSVQGRRSGEIIGIMEEEEDEDEVEEVDEFTPVVRGEEVVDCEEGDRVVARGKT